MEVIDEKGKKKKVKRYIGGVPLGLVIAEDIFKVNGRAPAKSPVPPRSTTLAESATTTEATGRWEPASPKP